MSADARVCPHVPVVEARPLAYGGGRFAREDRETSMTGRNSMKARGCALLVAGALLSSAALAERKYSDWGPAVSLGSGNDCGLINSTAGDVGPALSKDGLSLYFGSQREGGTGSFDLYVVQRTSPDAAWGVPANLGTVVNSSGIDNVPSLSRD